MDILSRNDDGTFDLVEVKSSTGVKDEHIPDVAIQLHVLAGSGVPIRRALLLHIDNTYVYEGGPYDLDRLFRMDDITDEQLADYLAGGQGEGKAGAFGYQDRLGWIHVVRGSESNVVGLPLELLAAMLRDMS